MERYNRKDNMLNFDTGLIDSTGKQIWVGDVLESQYGYLVLVCQGHEEGYYGSLICDIGHSCRNIPYLLGYGYDHTIVYEHKEEGFSREGFK